VTVTRNVESLEKTEFALHERFRRLFGDEDDDGTGQLARHMVKAEIDELSGAGEDDDDLAIEIKLENQYQQELSAQLNLMEKSAEKFQQHRTRVLNALNRELEDSTGKGYLELLEEELNALKVQIGRQ